ncbi:hypothetical protein LshimejAT787_0602650 [Lyophyllum shimeji]|uniref:Uncharacterized protein n=1 Tax=Lyophyllum shimeji TaxID=47721 RepID=A0A9P3PNG5_LYOSH|nr:hypothetical protein LshimejAT787_0602650 [Lyophyllum shimeji]
MATLPPELWGEIIYFATRLPSWCHPLASVSLTPFLVGPDDNVAAHQATLETRARIVLVSRLWNRLGTAFLYEYISLTRSSTFAALSSALEQQRSGVKRGSFVRAAIISYEPVVHFPHSVIISQLPNLEVIIHRQWSCPADYDRTVEFGRRPPPGTLPKPELPFLQSTLGNVKRIECHEHVNPRIDIPLDDLRQCLRMSSNIQCLAVRGYPRYIPLDFPFESLETLRIDPHPESRRSGLLPWSMPNLRSVVMHTLTMRSNPLCTQVLRQYGANLHTVELTISPDTLPRHDGDELSLIFHHCPRLQDLSYHVEVCRSPVFTHGPHTSLARLRLYARYADPRAVPEYKMPNTASSHFYAYTHRTVPNLKRILCYGHWKWIPRLQRLLETFAFEWDRGASSSDASLRPPVVEFVR